MLGGVWAALSTLSSAAADSKDRTKRCQLPCDAVTGEKRAFELPILKADPAGKAAPRKKEARKLAA